VKKQNKFFSYAKRWQVIAASVIATFGAFFYISNAIHGYVEGVADDIVKEKLAQYPPPEVWSEIKVTVSETNSKVNDLDKKLESIDSYLRGKGIK
jgi:hypothetical protein